MRGERATATYGSDGHTEAYTYTTDGYLETVSVNGTLRAERINDLLGRTTNYFEFATNGTALTYADIGQTYDNDNRLTSDTVKSAYVNGTSGTTTTEAYGYGAYVASKSNYSGTDQGVITNEVQTTGTVIVQTTWTYAWWDNQQQMTIERAPIGPKDVCGGMFRTFFASVLSLYAMARSIDQGVVLSNQSSKVLRVGQFDATPRAGMSLIFFIDRFMATA